jgi:hypothetical protein
LKLAAAEELNVDADQIPRFLAHQRVPTVTPVPLGSNDLADFVAHGRGGLVVGFRKSAD